MKKVIWLSAYLVFTASQQLYAEQDHSRPSGCDLAFHYSHIQAISPDAKQVERGGIIDLPEQDELKFHPTLGGWYRNHLVDKRFGSRSNYENAILMFAEDRSSNLFTISFASGLRVKVGDSKILFVVDDMVLDFDDELDRQLAKYKFTETDLIDLLVEKISVGRHKAKLRNPVRFSDRDRAERHRKHYSDLKVETNQEYENLANQHLSYAAEDQWNGLVFTRESRIVPDVYVVNLLDFEREIVVGFQLSMERGNELLTFYKLADTTDFRNFLFSSLGYSVHYFSNK